ncbi:ATP-dependent RNA helicase HrpA [Termitidicoccus mucosus]|uniref:ATP-dependent RNA helicase HrpA n=1 Tax=Termitidicoccus mucosus TaxID=1184151 RepID=A0A178IE44_9BACT|nr:ATP-dependent RNA helicase HrpA [Opitutaceae bacterium TSB47]
MRIDFPPALPISERAEEIVAAIQAHPVVILAGETGSGKTTQIPKMCLAAGRGALGKIACTQPRRVAALSISRRVAEELGVEWGREVGCKIRFSDQTSPSTIVKFMTDGMLLAEVQGDPMLRAYDTIIIDEAHERSLNIDFLLGHLRLLRHRRPELKIIITSATIDTAAFSKAFDDAPVIQVSGRTFPVEVVYAPLDGLGSDAAEDDEPQARAEALHYIDGAVEAVGRIVAESEGRAGGDILVFMPAERDIRETADLLEGRGNSRAGGGAGGLRDCEIVPLFGRLSNAEQQRVFTPTQRRKIVIATNIAETSLTIPGIRFVVDTGLARVSRYAAQARTRRLPIEEIAQSSADQRKGRCGRVAEGVCVRLYSEKDYNERPRFAQPEIQRANLADVILRMKAFGLGDIERFPFINMPAAKAIRAGYALLEELGALEQGGEPGAGAHRLTDIGRELARLPVDPTVGRMILQARREKCLREVAVIAAGLSIQDPRERPLEKQAQADAAHRRFAHPDSDFLTLLNIWEAFHDEFETMSQSRLRRFCRGHFLSYTRLREWRDIHAQLIDVMSGREDGRMSSVRDGLGDKEPDLAFGSPAYRAVHRSILTGLLGNIALRDDETGAYKSTHDRRVAIFPGSVLFNRDNDKARTSGSDARNKNDSKSRAKRPQSPKAVMAAEIMETSRLYARTCARFDPAWALELGAHLLKISHSEPFWDEEKGRVLVKQRSRLHGLELDVRAVGYGRVNPAHATEIFIREALVNDAITWPFDFLAHNRDVRAKVENLLTRARDSSYMNLDEAVYRFYAERLGVAEMGTRPCASVGPDLVSGREPPCANAARPKVEPYGESPPPVSSVPELIALVRERKPREPRFLEMDIEDLRDPGELSHDAVAFPEAVELENRALPLAYAYKPGQDDDGVTIEVNVRDAGALTAAALDWAVPGHLAAKVEHYLRVTPKELRRAFMPLAETARSLAEQAAGRDRLTGRSESLIDALAAVIAERFSIQIITTLWAAKPPPEHLRVRVRVVDDNGAEICAGRDLDGIRAAFSERQREASANASREDPAAWRRARSRWETPPQTAWTFGGIPACVRIGDQAGMPVEAFPGLQVETASFRSKKSGGSGGCAVHGRDARATQTHQRDARAILPADGVALRLFKTPEAARAGTARGLARLLECELKYELAWLERDLRALRELGPLAAAAAPMDTLQAQAFAMLRDWVCDAARVEGFASNRSRSLARSLEDETATAMADDAPTESETKRERARERLAEGGAWLTAEAFAAAVAGAKRDLRGVVPRLMDLLREILSARVELQVLPDAPDGLAADVAALVPPDFLRVTHYGRLAHLPRYLKAMRLRAGRWRQNPVKDAERVRALAPYAREAARIAGLLRAGEKMPPAWREAAEAFRWLVEEFRLSLFAQELGTAEPVSPVKLDRARAELRRLENAEGAGRAGEGADREKAADKNQSAAPAVPPEPASAPPAAMPLPSKKTKPIKSLNALGSLFQK